MNLPFLKSSIGADPVVLESLISAPVARVFAAWVTPDDIRNWFGAGNKGPEYVSVDLKEGGSWKVTFPESDGVVDSLGGEYVRIVSNELLEFTWVHTRYLEDGRNEQSAESTVTVTFEPQSDTTLVRLVHQGVAAESSRSNIGGGWGDSFAKLKALVE